jgi:hypothetical protein
MFVPHLDSNTKRKGWIGALVQHIVMYNVAKGHPRFRYKIEACINEFLTAPLGPPEEGQMVMIRREDQTMNPQILDGEGVTSRGSARMMVRVVMSRATLVPVTSFSLSTIVLQPTTYLGPLLAFTMTARTITPADHSIISSKFVQESLQQNRLPLIRTVQRQTHTCFQSCSLPEAVSA